MANIRYKLPLVSVGVLSYNRLDALKRTLNCICNQTYKNIRIIISDDASPNLALRKIGLNFQKKDKRVKYFRHLKNIGRFKNFKFLLKKAVGKYFMWASDDDLWDSRYIERCVSELEKNPQFDLVFTKFKLVSNCDKKKVKLNHNWYLRSKYRREIFLLLDESLTHKANMSYGVWKLDKLKEIMNKANFYGLSEKHMGKGFDQAFLLISLAEIDVYQIQEYLFIKRYINRIIPGSRKSIVGGTVKNLKSILTSPSVHLKKAMNDSGGYVKLISRVYNTNNLFLKKLIIFIKRLMYIIHGYIF